MSDLDALPDEDKAALKEALETWKKEGVENARIALDADGDGNASAFGLDENGELAIFDSVHVSDTVAESTGEETAAGAAAPSVPNSPPETVDPSEGSE